MKVYGVSDSELTYGPNDATAYRTRCASDTKEFSITETLVTR
jgi:hypothetical protein